MISITQFINAFYQLADEKARKDKSKSESLDLLRALNSYYEFRGDVEALIKEHPSIADQKDIAITLFSRFDKMSIAERAELACDLIHELTDEPEVREQDDNILFEVFTKGYRSGGRVYPGYSNLYNELQFVEWFEQCLNFADISHVAMLLPPVIFESKDINAGFQKFKNQLEQKGLEVHEYQLSPKQLKRMGGCGNE